MLSSVDEGWLGKWIRKFSGQNLIDHDAKAGCIEKVVWIGTAKCVDILNRHQHDLDRRILYLLALQFRITKIFLLEFQYLVSIKK